MNSRYDNSLTKYADGMAISYTYKMTGLDHTILNRSKYGLLSDSEKEEIMCNLAENYFMSYKRLRLAGMHLLKDSIVSITKTYNLSCLSANMKVRLRAICEKL